MSSKDKKMEKLDEENRLVAVIIADTFDDKFYPATQDCPKALLSLVNNPLIFYSFEWLKRSKIDDTIVYCNQKDAEEIRSHCKKWMSIYGNRMKLVVISSDTCSSLGDAIRDLYSKSLLKKDFILLNGFVVGNIDLREAFQKHKESVQEDPSCIMTCVYRKPTDSSGTKPRNMDNIRFSYLLLNEVTLRILNHYRSSKSSKFVMPSKLIASNPRVTRLSVEDPQISICSERVPMLYSDNFDYDTRDSLIQGVLDQEDLLNFNIRAFVPERGLTQLVSSLGAYEEFSKLLIKRWFSPLVPERSLSTQRMRYRYDDWHANYYDESAKFHSNALGDYNVIDAGTEIDQRCKMNNSVVGKHCIIKGNVTINDSFLMDNVTIGNGCIIDNCFIGSNVKLLPGVHLEPGVVLGSNTVIDTNVKVDRCKRLVSNPPEGASSEVNPLLSGKEGRAFEVAVDEETKEQVEPRKYGLKDLKWGELPPVEDGLLSDSEDSKLEESDAALDEDCSSDEEREHEFGKEVMDSLINAYKDESRLSSVKLELNSSRHAYNVSWENVLRDIVKTVVHIVEIVEGEPGEKLTGDKLWQCVKKGLKYYSDLIKSYATDTKSQVIILNLLESLVNEEERYLGIMPHIFHQLNQDLEIIDDEVVIYWFRKGGHKTPKFPLIAKKIQNFVVWLENASEEEDDDEEEEEED